MKKRVAIITVVMIVLFIFSAAERVEIYEINNALSDASIGYSCLNTAKD